MARLPVIAPLPDYTSLDENTVPVDREQIVEDNSQQVLGQGITKAADTLQDAVTTSQQTAANEAKNLARAKASNAATDHEIAVKTLGENLTQQVQSGQLPYAQARQAFDDQAAKIPTPAIANLDPIGQENYQKLLKRNVATSGLAMDGVVRQAQKNDYQDQFVAALDNGQKLAGMPGADINQINSNIDSFRPQALNAGIPAAKVDEAIQNFKDQNWLNDATQKAMLAKDNMPALKQLQSDLTATDGFYAGKLDTNKRNIVLRDVTNDQITLQNRIEHEQDKREAKAGSAMNQMNEQIATGVPATPAMWDTLEATTKGTSFEDNFKQTMAAEQKVQDVLRMPPAQQQQYVQDQQQQLDSQGGTLRDRANLMRLQSAVKQNVTMMQTQPLTFAATRNGTGPVAPLDFTQLNTSDGQQAMAGQVADRMNTLSALRKQYGPQIGMAPLLPQEASQLSSQLDSATPQAKMGLLTALHSSMGNDEAYQATMRQIAPHSPVTAIVGQMTGQSAPASTPVWFDPKFAPKASDGAAILGGDAMLNPGKGAPEKDGVKTTVPMPPEGTPNSPGLRDAFAAGAKDMFRGRPDLADSYFAAFKAADASLRAQAGDFKGEPNATQFEKPALAMALGNVQNFNGSSVKVPAGMDPSQFKGLVNNAVGAVVKSAGGKDDWADRLQGYQLHELGGVGTGRYAVMDGNIPFARPDGKGPIIIDLRNQYLPSRVGTAPAQ